MIRLLGSIKPITAVAVSGGPDSMAALNFIRNANPDVMAIYFDHGTVHGAEARAFVASYCQKERVKYRIGAISNPSIPAGDSPEDYWRTQRYHYLHSLKEHTIATAHHLNDAAETYLWGCLHGQARFIHYRQPSAEGPSNIVRPFLLVPKTELLAWNERHHVPSITDPSNQDTKYTRNLIRHKLMPEALKVNPGFLSTVRKLLVAQVQV